MSVDPAAQLAEPDQDVGEEAAEPASPVGSAGPSSPSKGAHGLVGGRQEAGLCLDMEGAVWRRGG